MGDIINNLGVFKKLGFDSSNQWIFYDERFQKFFDYFSKNISDLNILTEHEILERDDLLQVKKYNEGDDLRKKLDKLKNENPGLLKFTENDVNTLKKDIEFTEKTESSYQLLVEDMRCSKNDINYRLTDLEAEINVLKNTEKELINTCQEKTQQLEELQQDNSKISYEAKNCFTKLQSPPLFMHQLSLDQYFLKCDSFTNYFTLYMKQNFKMQDYLELDATAANMQTIGKDLENLGNYMKLYTLAYIREKSKAYATKALFDQLDMTQIGMLTLPHMTRKAHELELINKHHLKSATNTLNNNIEIHVHMQMQQRMELVLYENTKLKLKRARERHEIDKRLTKIISDALSNAELIWIAVQLDLERKRNGCENSTEMNTEAYSCMQRIQIMQNLQALPARNSVSNVLVEQMSQQLSEQSAQKVRSEMKACLYEYEKLCRLTTYSLQGMLTKRSYNNAMEKLNELARVEQILLPFVYDGPVTSPLFENMRFLKPIFNAKNEQNMIEKTLRELRAQFQDNIADRMERDKFWRYSQLLWVWYLIEPKRVLSAIEEVKQVASKLPSMTGIRTLAGIKRML